MVIYIYHFLLFKRSLPRVDGTNGGANFFEGKSRGNDKDNQEISKGMLRVGR